MLPFDFTVAGPPLSNQSNNKDRLEEWRKNVLAAARASWPPGNAPLEVELELRVTYYHDGNRVRIDDDNLVKPIQDALIGHLYVDDVLITDTHVRKTPIDGSYRVRFMSRALADAFVNGHEFIHVQLLAAPAHENLP